MQINKTNKLDRYIVIHLYILYAFVSYYSDTVKQNRITDFSFLSKNYDVKENYREKNFKRGIK